jgi:acyl-[acyl-carrier-protein] desaturase
MFLGEIPNSKINKSKKYMSIKNIRLEVMQLLEKNVSSYVDQYLIPVEKIWQPSDFLPNSESDTFLDEVKELREISKDLPYDFWVAIPKKLCQPMKTG